MRPDSETNWLNEGGPHADVVISSRVRLARNLSGFPFINRASTQQKRDLLANCRAGVMQADLRNEMHWIDLAEASAQERQLFVERHLISKQHGQAKTPRGVAVSDDSGVAVMVNEEDHIRLQIIRGGLRLKEAYDGADAIDDALEQKMEFAFTRRLGYLTACPTNVGTGIRVSVMLHLPALKITGEIDKLRRAAKDMHLAVRGFHGEGSEAMGDLYQVSNQTTLGRTEQQTLSDFADVIIPKMIEYEHKAREALVNDRRAVLDDRVWRAWGTLRYARLLGSEEALFLLSVVRLGVAMERIRIAGVTAATINQLFVLIQPAHLQRLAERQLTGPERRAIRAEFIRTQLEGLTA